MILREQDRKQLTFVVEQFTSRQKHLCHAGAVAPLTAVMVDDSDA